MIYYISEPHFGHANIIRLCSRPFDSVEEMDKVIMENWNLHVSDSDDIYILGDLMFRNTRPPDGSARNMLAYFPAYCTNSP